MKVCTRCKQKKDLKDFYKLTRAPGGLDSICKICCRQYARNWYSSNKESRKAYSKEYYYKNREVILQKLREKPKKQNKTQKQIQEKLEYLRQYYKKNKAVLYKKQKARRARIKQTNDGS